jgi:nicotinic acid mononucleotide adenylyltransferase
VSVPAPNEDLATLFSDFENLRRLQQLVESCSPAEPPYCRLLLGEHLQDAQSLAVLAGSFNPLTVAHLALAETTEREKPGGVVFALATRTVDKEQPQGALLADRLLVLEAHALRSKRRAVALVNRGLYVEQAELLLSALPQVQGVTFLVGFDKIVQVFDPRYYENRDAALERLFSRASFSVAPRSGSGRDDLARLLARPENARFAHLVSPIDVAGSIADVSSSSLRAALAAGDQLPAGLATESAAFIEATGCYRTPRSGPGGAPIDRYAERRKQVGANP